mgnify:CR=1 FL=1
MTKSMGDDRTDGTSSCIGRIGYGSNGIKFTQEARSMSVHSRITTLVMVTLVRPERTVG